MGRVINFEGRKITVPDDATDEEVAGILGGGDSGGSIGPAAVAKEPASAVESLAGSPAGVVANDMARSGLTGIREGVEGAGAMMGDAADLQGKFLSWASSKAGASPETQAFVQKWGGRLHPGGASPDTAQIREHVTDPLVTAAGAGDVLAHDPQTMAGKVMRVAGQMLPNAANPGGVVRKIASVAVPAVLSEGAGQLTEGTTWEPYARFLGALTGGVATVGKGGAPTAARTTVEDLKTAGNAAYKASEDAGVVVNKTGMRTLAKKVVDDLTDHGFDPANEPGAMAALKRIAQGSNGNVTLKGLDTIRKVASNGYTPGNASNNKVISQIIARIDELIASEDPALMAGIDTPAGVKALQNARKTWARARKLETVEKFVKRGKAIGDSQINQDVEGATRRQVRTLLTNDAKARGFTKAELNAAKKAASMTPGMRALRVASGMLPQGKLGGMFQIATAAAHGFNPLLLAGQGAGAAAGYAAKLGEAALSKRAMDEFVDLIANGAPRVKPSRTKALSKPEGIARILLAAEGGRVSAEKRQPLRLTVGRARTPVQ